MHIARSGPSFFSLNKHTLSGFPLCFAIQRGIGEANANQDGSGRQPID
jgi:hypothetical protein